jgi:L-methionine (R)-S-oxide reductase
MSVVEKIKVAISKSTSFAEKCSTVVEKLKAAFPHYNWVGIYQKDGNFLKLLTYRGDFETPHKVINIEKGICGKAAREGKTIIVPDVSKAEEYLMCSVNTKSEIVVPIKVNDKNVIGEIDIDSFKLDAFSDADKIILEEVAQILEKEYCKKLFSENAKGINKLTIRVGYKDTDKMGVVHHSNFLVYFEIARTELLRNLGVSYKEIEQHQTFLVVKDVSLKIYRSAYYDDVLTIETFVTDTKRSSITFFYQMFNQNSELIAEGETRIFSVDEHTRKLKSLDSFIIEKLEKLRSF